MSDEEETRMHPEFLHMTIEEHEREIRERARKASLRRELTEAALPETILLRLCTVADDPTLDRLAELEGRPQPRGRHVVAEIDGAVVAALPLAGGPALADPFRSTAPLMPPLELRRKQLAPVQPSAIARLTERAKAATRLQPAR
jgi:hypothetical protein